jgi:hypothetical protein
MNMTSPTSNSNNLLVSLRNDSDGTGTPGHEFNPTGKAVYISTGDASYNLKKDSKTEEQWLFDVQTKLQLGLPTMKQVLVFAHGFGNQAKDVVAPNNSIKKHVTEDFVFVSFDWPSGNPP